MVFPRLSVIKSEKIKENSASRPLIMNLCNTDSKSPLPANRCRCLRGLTFSYWLNKKKKIEAEGETDNCTACRYGSIAWRRKFEEKRPGGNSSSTMPTSCLQSKSKASCFVYGKVRQEKLFEVDGSVDCIVIMDYRKKHCCKIMKAIKTSKSLSWLRQYLYVQLKTHMEFLSRLSQHIS